MKRYFGFFLLFLLVSSCAKRGVITGGPKDTLAPVLVNSHPENFSTGFSANEIKIVFNEYIKVKDISKQLIISPPLKKAPEIYPMGVPSKYITIKIKDSLQPNTTYSFNFGQSITDNNEGNPYQQFKYVFSTGNYIDSLRLMGKIKDAIAQKPDNFVSVMLYDAQTYTDSTAYKTPPRYITNTLDSLTTFALDNLKAGKYRIIALKDQNKNNKYDPKTEKIGFLNEVITLPNDTLFLLELFNEQKTFKTFKPIQNTKNKLVMGYEGNPKNIKVTLQHLGKTLPCAISKFPKKDSINIWIPPVSDSVAVQVEHQNYTKTYSVSIKSLKATDTLSLMANKEINFRDDIYIETTTPITQINPEYINLRDKDSVAIPFSTKYNSWEQKLYFNFKKDENQTYRLQLLPKALTDFYGKTNDTLTQKYTTQALTDYGNLKVTLQNPNRFPIIIQILDNDKVEAQQVIHQSKEVYFDAIPPKIYTLRIIYDDNNNQEWDTGNFLQKIQPEQIQYYPKGIDVRANWDVDQIFDLK